MDIQITIQTEECPYWNYDTHTRTHTCCDCTCVFEGNNINNSKFGVMVGQDRYCTLECKIHAEMVEATKQMK